MNHLVTESSRLIITKRPRHLLRGTIIFGLIAFTMSSLGGQTQGLSTAERAQKVDRTTLSHKLMCGYQGWFAVPSDAINRGWYHYNLSGKFEPGFCKIDLWPDLSEMGVDEKYATSFKTASGATAYVFSSQNQKTVVRHFKWMSDYGIDGVFIQRFASEVMGSGLNQFNNVLVNCQAGAHQYGRVFAIMYDLSGIKAGDWKKVLTDWRVQIVQKKILQDSCYLYHNGKPVVAVWGIGFNDGRKYTLSECSQLIDSLKNHPLYGGNTVMIGVPTYWRTLDRDALPNDTLLSIAQKSDIVSPWFVGRYSQQYQITAHANDVVAGDLSWCSARGKDYLPVAFPGFSWHNMNSGSPLNQIPRLGGAFLWQQYYEFIRVGATMLYQSMFDEIDEGTAIFKCTNDPPVGASNFVTYEGLPSYFYLWLVGKGTQMLRGEIPLSGNLPDTVAVGIDKGPQETPKEYRLNQNYPNPWNPSTSISYSVPHDSFVTLTVFNVLGQRVRMLCDGRRSPGAYATSWDGRNDEGAIVPSGVYYYRLSTAEACLTNKMMLLR